MATESAAGKARFHPQALSGYKGAELYDRYESLSSDRRVC